MAVAVTFVVVYTTLYREGGPKFQRAARQKADELSRAHPGATVVCRAVESKRAFVDVVRAVAERGDTIRELHFIGHGGMYGPMFRTTAMPEQFSPHEWRTLAIPFAEDASAYFHACRSGRFFARFFAQTFGVVAYGYFHYTTLSRRPDRFVWDSPLHGEKGPLFVVAMPGKKSHGFLGSLAKYSHLYPVEKMLRFEPSPPPDASYDGVAELYDETFRDIGVRGPEVAWVDAHVPRGRPAVLELGCGNGALLARLAPRIERGLGVDASPRMVELARRRFGALANIAFAPIDGPRLPAADASVDVVVSLLSWRYLDWDPMIAEVRRVLAPGGRLLVVDMVELPAKLRELPRVARSKARELYGHARAPRFRASLKRLVSDPRWKAMLRQNPIRAEHEYRWYFESRFPGRALEVLSVGYRARVVAFDTGPLERGFTLPQSYP